MFETQTDLIELGYAAARQPNTAAIRTWEVAGHLPRRRLFGRQRRRAFSVAPRRSTTGPSTRWSRRPSPPSRSGWTTGRRRRARPRSRLASTSRRSWRSTATATSSVGCGHRRSMSRCRRSAARRRPGPASICALFGSTVPFSPSTLASLYRTKSNYLAAYTASLDKAIKGGYILSADRASLLAQAQQVQIPS